MRWYLQVQREQLQRKYEADLSRGQFCDQRRGRNRFHVLVRYRRLLYFVSRGQRSENAAGRGAAAADVRVAFHLGADAQFPIVVGRERVRRVRPG